jgi:hypothetical protein
MLPKEVTQQFKVLQSMLTGLQSLGKNMRQSTCLLKGYLNTEKDRKWQASRCFKRPASTVLLPPYISILAQIVPLAKEQMNTWTFEGQCTFKHNTFSHLTEPCSLIFCMCSVRLEICCLAEIIIVPLRKLLVTQGQRTFKLECFKHYVQLAITF